jgi:selenocysteine lyase/cysteine desulfurase
VDAHTRVIAVSQVNYLTGVQHNLEALRAIADQAGAHLYADVTHAAGAAPVPAALCDFTVTATYKWLLGTYGVALLTWNRARVPELEPAIVGWRSIEGGLDGGRYQPKWKPGAERLEAGNPPHAAIFTLDVALSYLLSLGMGRIALHVAALSRRMHDGLRWLGLPLATPADPRWRAGNNCFWTEEPEAIVAALAERDIIASGYSGRMRFSTHVWNDERDVDRCLAALESIVHRAPLGAR